MIFFSLGIKFLYFVSLDLGFFFFFLSPRIEDVSDIKLIRTDTTLDLSQKAEKRSI